MGLTRVSRGASYERMRAPYMRMTIPRGLVAGTLVAVALVWGLYAIDPARSLLSSGVQTGVYVGLLVLTARSRRMKVLLVRTLQRWIINPLMRVPLAIGVNPLGLAVLETRAGPGDSGGCRSATAARATRSGSSPSTGCARDTYATSCTTRGSGCVFASACVIDGCPVSPPSCPTTTRWRANAA